MDTREQVLKVIKQKAQSVSLDELQRQLESRFFRMHEPIRCIYTAFVSGENLLLYGPGGFGKSQLVKAILDIMGIPKSVILGYFGMEPEALIGIPDMDKLLKESVYQIAFEKTAFMNSGMVVLEEFLDCVPETAMVLKDILSEGGYRRGNEFVEGLFGSVVICTNKDPNEIALDDSSKALYMERFSIQCKVVWDEFSTETYRAFIHSLNPDLPDTHINVLAEICSKSVKTKGIISPRIVKVIINILSISDNDMSVLKYIPILDTTTLIEIMSRAKATNERQNIDKICTSIYSHIRPMVANSKTTMNQATSYLSDLETITTKLTSLIPNYPNSVDVIAECLKSISEKQSLIKEKFIVEQSLETKKELKELFK